MKVDFEQKRILENSKFVAGFPACFMSNHVDIDSTG